MEDNICSWCGIEQGGVHLTDCIRPVGFGASYRTTAEDLSTIQDPIYNPPHYAHAPKHIEVIEGWNLGSHEAHVIRYVLRAKYKGMELKDLQKARWYLDRKIWILEGKPDGK